MSARVPVRAVKAIEELEGIAEYIGLRAGDHAKVAVLQIQAAVAELIAADLEFDAAFNNCRETINSTDQLVISASLSRWTAAQERRSKALSALQGVDA